MKPELEDKLFPFDLPAGTRPRKASSTISLTSASGYHMGGRPSTRAPARVVTLEDVGTLEEVYVRSAPTKDPLRLDLISMLTPRLPKVNRKGWRATMPNVKTRLVYDGRKLFKAEDAEKLTLSNDDARQMRYLQEEDDARDQGSCSRARWRDHLSWNHLAPANDRPTAGPAQCKGASLIDLVEVRTAVRLHVVQNAFKVGAANLTLESLTDWINERIVCKMSYRTGDGADKVYSVCRETVRRWLHELGFSVKVHSKGIFYDGHDDAEVLAARDVYLDTMRGLRRRARFTWVNEKGEFFEHVPQLEPGEKEVVFVYHDEASAKTNDGERFYWGSAHEQVLKKKSDGANFMVSDFIVSSDGSYLALSDAEMAAWNHSRASKVLTQLHDASTPEQQAARVLVATGKSNGDCVLHAAEDHGLPGNPWLNANGYWDNKSFTRQVNLAIRIFDIKYPRCEMVLIVDNSSGHYAKAMTALNTVKMNVKPGSKAKTIFRMQPGSFPVAAPGANPPHGVAAAAAGHRHQPMCTGEEGYEYFKSRDEQGVPVEKLKKEGKSPGATDADVCYFLANAQPKGMKQVLAERYDNTNGRALRADGTPAIDCANLTADLLAVELNKYSDFKSTVSRIEMLCTAHGHTCLFLPKFHPEMNPIELCWRDSKEALRKICNASSKEFKRKWAVALR